MVASSWGDPDGQASRRWSQSVGTGRMLWSKNILTVPNHMV